MWSSGRAIGSDVIPQLAWLPHAPVAWCALRCIDSTVIYVRKRIEKQDEHLNNRFFTMASNGKISIIERLATAMRKFFPCVVKLSNSELCMIKSMAEVVKCILLIVTLPVIVESFKQKTKTYSEFSHSLYFETVGKSLLDLEPGLLKI